MPSPSSSTVPLLFHPWVVVAVVGLSGSGASGSVGPPLLMAASWVAFSSTRERAPGAMSRTFLFWVFLALVFLGAQARATADVEDYQETYRRVVEHLEGPKRCFGSGRVVSSPTRVTSQTDASKITLLNVQTDDLDCEGRRFDAPLSLRLYGGPADLARGDRLEFVAQLAAVRHFRNGPLSNPYPSAARRGTVLSGSALVVTPLSRSQDPRALVDRARAFVRARILATFSQPASPLGRALVLGENDLSEQDQEAFLQSGLMHLLAVSGTHLVLSVLAFVKATSALLRRTTTLSRRYDVDRFAFGLGAVFSLIYADFSGGSGSAWRAAFMLCVACGARAWGVVVRGPAALGASLLMGLVLDPLCAYDYSFLLSALATAGLIAWGQPLCSVLSRTPYAPLRLALQSFSATLSSTLACAPVLALMGSEMSVAALFANLVAGPLGEVVALPVCLLHAISAWNSPLESGLATLGSGALFGVRAVALWSASVDQARLQLSPPQAWDVVSGCFLLCALTAVGRLTHRVRLDRGINLCLLLGWLLWSHERTRLVEDRPRLAITALDVGQGDALVLDFPDGTTGLLDGGGFATGVPDTGKRVILPYLRARGIERLGIMILSHAHPDHMRGLISVAEKIPVNQLWIPDMKGNKSRDLRRLEDSVQSGGGTVVVSSKLCGRAWERFGATLRVLSPCEPEQQDWELNDGSLVVRIQFGERVALLTGDVERQAEDWLLSHQRPYLPADLLKVAHHGSDTSSTAPFLRAVSPTVALISCGVRNRFAHPRPTTLRKLAARDVLSLRTDTRGSITWSTDGRRQEVRAFESE